MRQLPGIDPERLPVVGVLAAAAGLCLLLGGAVAVYGAVDGLGALLVIVFLFACFSLAASGWLLHWGVIAAPSLSHPTVERRSALRNAGQDSPMHRLLEAVAGEVKEQAANLTGFAELLPPSEGGEARLQLIDGSRGLLSFATELHDFIRFERGRLRLREQQVDAGELVEAALASCRSTADVASTTILGNVFEGVELSCDAARLRQAVTSLVLWAVQSSGSASLIDVSLERLESGGLAIDIVSRGEPVGSAQPRERLFEPQLSATGLKGFALPMARRVALLHGGDVTATANPAEAISARLTLPAARLTWPEAKEAARAA